MAKSQKLKVSGVWKSIKAWLKISGLWKICKVWQKISGTWKLITPVPFYMVTAANDIIDFGDNFKITNNLEIEFTYKYVASTSFGPMFECGQVGSTSYNWRFHVNGVLGFYISGGEYLETPLEYQTLNQTYRVKLTYVYSTKTVTIYVYEDGNWVSKASKVLTNHPNNTAGYIVRYRQAITSKTKLYYARLKGQVSGTEKDCEYDMYFDIGTGTIKDRKSSGPDGTLKKLDGTSTTTVIGME